MGIEVRAVGPEAFEEIYPLLRLFPTHRMSKEDWRWMLFANSWSDREHRGYALYADGKPVGFIGTLVTTRPVRGRLERFCNPSSWIVLEGHRWAAHLLLRPILSMRDHTLVNLTPSPAAFKMFSKLGFVPLESCQLVLPPVPRLGEALRARHGFFTTSPEDLRSELSGDERTLYEDMSSSPVARHALLGRGRRRCYVVATLRRRKHVPYAELQYIGDTEFFWENRILAHAALARLMGVAGLALGVDCRFVTGRPGPFAVRLPAPRLYRPARPDISPEMVDGLYSEMMGIRY